MTVRQSGPWAAVLLFSIALPVTAQEVSLTAGAGITSNYLEDGVTKSDDRPAIQGYFEAQRAGLYAGVWGSTVKFDDTTSDHSTDDRLEVDLYLGFRNETVSGVSYDLSYRQEFYDDTGNCCGKVIGSVLAPLGQVVRAGGEVKADVEDQEMTWTGLAGVKVSPALDISARYGYSGEYGETFGDIGATYALSDTSRLDVRYHDTTEAGTNGRLVLTLGFANNFLSR